MEHHLGVPGFELRSARLPRRALRFPLGEDTGERVCRSCSSPPAALIGALIESSAFSGRSTGPTLPSLRCGGVGSTRT
jgi:hypothetical protein